MNTFAERRPPARRDRSLATRRAGGRRSGSWEGEDGIGATWTGERGSTAGGRQANTFCNALACAVAPAGGLRRATIVRIVFAVPPPCRRPPAGGALWRAAGLSATLWLAALESAGAGASDASAMPYIVQSWQTEHGLPQNYVTSIAQTDDGYLWIGTYN